jgi:hypothetical protein
MRAALTLLPKTKTGKLVMMLVPIALLSMSYLTLLGMQSCSSWQASKMLDRLEALRVGDPVSRFSEATRGCIEIDSSSKEITCRIASGAYRLTWGWTSTQRLPGEWGWRLQQAAWRAGLRHWQVVVTCTLKDSRINGIYVRSHVIGRYEALGAQWSLAPTIPEFWQRELRDKLSSENRRTFMNWFHITSMPKGLFCSCYAG